MTLEKSHHRQCNRPLAFAYQHKQHILQTSESSHKYTGDQASSESLTGSLCSSANAAVDTDLALSSVGRGWAVGQLDLAATNCSSLSFT